MEDGTQSLYKLFKNSLFLTPRLPHVDDEQTRPPTSDSAEGNSKLALQEDL